MPDPLDPAPNEDVPSPPFPEVDPASTPETPLTDVVEGGTPENPTQTETGAS